MPAASISKVLCLYLLAWCLAARAEAEPPQPGSIPAVLTPWIPWVLADAGNARCPLIGSARVCVWPSSLSLDADRQGATFSLSVTTDRETLVTLPGSIEHWPLDVRTGTTPSVVIEPGGAPQIRLPAGSHVLGGRFQWPRLPDSVQVPINLGTLLLTVNGRRSASPKRDAQGLVWLARGAGRESEGERLELSVHRRIDDGVPMRVTTRIQVSAAGAAREVVLPHVLVAGSRPIELRAELPAQLSSDGSLRMQTQAGSYRIEIVAICERPLETLRAPQASAPWPEREYWVFASDDALRHVELPNTKQIDPSRTDLASDWHNLQTVVVLPGDALTLVTRRRGEPDPAPNELSLERAMWLDLDGNGYTVQDSLTGKMHRDFRLDLLAGALGHVAVAGTDELVTQHDKKRGVELRKGTVALKAEWRLDGPQREIPAVGWSEDMRSLRTTLHLPPGFLLLGAGGVDRVPGTWFDHWNLWDFFFVLLIALAVAKLKGPAWGVLAVLTLVLSHHEADSPEVAWLCLLAATALMRAVEAPRWMSVARVVWGFGLLGLLLVAVPFSVAQLRKALYPQVDPHLSHGIQNSFQALDSESGTPAAEPAEQLMESADQGLKTREVSPMEPTEGGAEQKVAQAPAPRSKSAAKLKGASSLNYDRNDVDPQAVVQTGPGVPSWSWRSLYLSWSGPVRKDQRIKLWLVPPLAMRAWSLLTVLLNFALLLGLATAVRRPQRPRVPPEAILLLLLCWAPLAEAQRNREPEVIPSNDMLDTLRERLLEPAECEPNCVSVPQLNLSIEDARLALRAEVHSGAQATYRAPGPLESWAPDTIKVDGKPALAAVRFEDGFLHVRVPAGRHQVELSGAMPSGQTLTLELGSPPHLVQAHAPGFVVEGLRADGRAERSLALRREVAVDSAAAEPQALLQWFDVRRSFDLGVRFRVTTTLHRLGLASESALVRLPLLPGESVTEAGLTSENGSVVIELARDQREQTFSSTLPSSGRIELKAAMPTDPTTGQVLRPWNESWDIACAPIYHCTFEGVAPVSRLLNGAFRPLYRPWPDEKLLVLAERLDGAPGASVTIDEARLDLTPGSRIEQGLLSLKVRTSRGSTRRISLPNEGSLLSLSVNGTPRPARIKNGAVELRVDPGSHLVSLAFQRPVAVGARYASPKVKVDQPLSNVTTSVSLPPDRWLLFARGPSWGPAILFWGYLLMVVLVGFGLARVPISPLKTHEWVLLGLGLTQVEAAVGLIIVGWLFALALRREQVWTHRWAFNLRQIALVLFSCVALFSLAFAVHQGLVVQPDMQVQGTGSSNTLLNWYVDRTGGGFPSVSVMSLPLWVYKSLMLLWALWLAASLLRWLHSGFQAFRTGGVWMPAPGKGAA